MPLHFPLLTEVREWLCHQCTRPTNLPRQRNITPQPQPRADIDAERARDDQIEMTRKLQLKVADIEDRSRCNNIKLRGIP